MEPIRILLADDHVNVRVQIRTRLSHEPDIEIVGEASDSTQALALARATVPQIVLMDPIMRDGRGLAVVSQIARDWPRIAIVILTAFVDTALHMELQQMRVSLILDKGIESAQLVSHLRRVAQAA